MPTLDAAPRTSTMLEGFDFEERQDGTAVILDVPIFCTCERAGKDYNEAWLRAAFNRLRQASEEGHLPPIQLHHERAEAEPPIAVGMFEATRIGPLRWRGRERPWIFANLLVTNRDAFAAIRERRLPYRSVTIDHQVGAGEIISLSLLDSQAPFIEGPMTFLRGVAPATNRSVSFERVRGDGGAVVAFCAEGTRTLVLMEATMAEDKGAAKDESAEAKDRAAPSEKSGESKGGESKGGGGGAGASAAKALVEKLRTTKVELEDSAEVISALEELLSSLKGGGSESKAPKPSDALAEPAAMSRGATDEVLALRATVTAMQRKIDAQEAAQTLATAIDKARKDLAARSYADEDLLAFAKSDGVRGVEIFVATTLKVAPENTGGTRFARATPGETPKGSPGDVPPEVTALKCASPEEQDGAIAAFKAYSEVAKRGHLRGIDFGRYFDLNKHLFVRTEAPAA